MRAVLRHAHIARDQAAELWHRVFDLFDEFSSLPSSSGSAYALAVRLSPTDHSNLPAPGHDPLAARTRKEPR